MYGRNPTWFNYQKLIGHIIGQDIGRNNYNFLDFCLMTEMNDIYMLYSDYAKTFDNTERKKLEALRLESLINRPNLFKMAFVLIALGLNHKGCYNSRDYNLLQNYLRR